MQEGVKKIYSQSESSIYVHNNPAASLGYNNLQSSFNNESTYIYHIPIVSIGKYIYFIIIYQPDPFKKLSKTATENNFESHKYFLEAGKIFVMNWYNIF